jgi:hypothetical protein
MTLKNAQSIALDSEELAAAQGGQDCYVLWDAGFKVRVGVCPL